MMSHTAYNTVNTDLMDVFDLMTLMRWYFKTVNTNLRWSHFKLWIEYIRVRRALLFYHYG